MPSNGTWVPTWEVNPTTYYAHAEAEAIAQERTASKTRFVAAIQRAMSPVSTADIPAAIADAISYLGPDVLSDVLSEITLRLEQTGYFS